MDSFIKAADTGAYIVRRNYLNDPELLLNPNIQSGKVLNYNYLVAYSNVVLDNYTVFYKSAPYTLMARRDLDSVGITAYWQNPYLDTTGADVLMGFVDTGIDYTQPAFRWEDGSTRIKYIWDQSLEGGDDFDYKYGVEFNSDQINEALDSVNPYEIVNHYDETGHGTFLASAAGGRGSGEYDGAAVNAEFLVVKLKEASQYCRKLFLVPDDEDNIFEAADIIQGIDYLIERAAELKRPIAVCIGVGTNFVGHDSLSVVSDYLSTQSSKAGVLLCCAAGNEGGSAHHYRTAFAKTSGPHTLEIRVKDSSPSFMINVWSETGDSISVSMTSPGGEAVPHAPVKVDQPRDWNLIMEPSKINISYLRPYYGSISQYCAIKIYDPVPGIWKLTLHPDIIVIGVCDIWLPGDGMGGEYVSFVKPDPLYTLTAPGTSVGVITCTAYNSRDNSMYADASNGSTRQDLYYKPDISAPGVEVGGIFPDGPGVMTGTSVAAAIVTGACALLLQWGRLSGYGHLLNTYYVKALLIQGCEHDANMYYPNLKSGYGRMNLYNTFLAMRTI
ncbi:MAG: S8 family peptidase [Clostridiales bacterium]|jgi:subtilisin family serine protease|nr:S8 family peptidase [Clostridiales bacterium]